MRDLEMQLQSIAEKAEQVQRTALRRTIASVIIPVIVFAVLLSVVGWQLHQTGVDAAKVKIKTDELQRKLDELRKEYQALIDANDQILIVTPSNQAAVSATSLIGFRSSFTQLNHYVIITPLRTGEGYIQGPAILTSDGRGTAHAFFGSADVGREEKFKIQILATRAVMQPGPLSAVPEDATFSKPRYVVRWD